MIVTYISFLLLFCTLLCTFCSFSIHPLNLLHILYAYRTDKFFHYWKHFIEHMLPIPWGFLLFSFLFYFLFHDSTQLIFFIFLMIFLFGFRCRSGRTRKPWRSLDQEAGKSSHARRGDRNKYFLFSRNIDSLFCKMNSTQEGGKLMS